jgi:hypothetical protein
MSLGNFTFVNMSFLMAGLLLLKNQQGRIPKPMKIALYENCKTERFCNSRTFRIS